MTLNLSIPDQNDLRPRITVCGVGGAGGNAVNNMIEKSLDGVISSLQIQMLRLFNKAVQIAKYSLVLKLLKV